MLNTSSLLFAHVASLSTATLLLCLLWFLRFPFRGPGWWAISYFIAICSIVLLNLRDSLPASVAIVGGNFLLLGCMILLWYGLRLFLEKPGFKAKHWIMLSLCLTTYGSAIYWFSAVHNLIQIRFILFTLYTSAIMLFTLYDIKKDKEEYRSLLLLYIIYTIYIIAIISSIFVFYFYNFNDPWSSTCNHIYIFIHDMTFIALAFCYMMMTSERLLHVVLKQYKELNENIKFRNQMENLLYHDLKSPLMPIVYLPDIILQKETLSESGQNKIFQIKEAAQRIMGLINEALIAHKFENKMQVDRHAVDVLQLFRKVNDDLRTLRSEKNLHMVLQTDPSLDSPGGPRIHGDESLLYRMYANLLKNAFQAAPVDATVAVFLDRHQDRLRIAIRNPGEVPQSIRSCFFDKYSRDEHSEGLGLGTYSAKLAVQAHGGDIALNAEHPGMTEITVLLPFSPN